MITIKIKDREGKVHTTEMPTDMNLNLMEVCKSLNLPVEGTCGGMALCASCHCYVTSDHSLPQKKDDEMDMLDNTFNVKENSRLCCQLYLDKSMEGIEIEIAPL